ncbi:beta-N-acetylhexosaminidase [Belliella marina]|uniref:beta-N-acetylhexosaminidase n=1 Tax=Belliella marina TaxID=1644146 RepID=A0ABW4VT50_9BACT
MSRLILIISIVLFSSTAFGQVNIIPEPSSVHMGSGVFTVDRETVIVYRGEVSDIVEVFADRMRQATGYPFGIMLEDSNSTFQNIIRVIEDPSLDLEDEGYLLDITETNAFIRSSSRAGIHNGIQTLRQLFPAEIEREIEASDVHWVLPTLSIEDLPRFSWRGYMKDVSRTFYSVDVLKKYIDVMSYYKLNMLHLHLTDDQGWRIEIKKYPELTSEKATVFPGEFDQPSIRSGYYTQEEIRDLVDYASKRNVTIVPEIDVPGHIWPALIAYPELGVNDKLDPDYVFPFLDSWSIWGNQFTPNTLDPSNEKVYGFLNDVFTEITELFPSEYLHFGGDEVRHDLWETQPHVVKFMEEKGMTSTLNLQSYFVDRVVHIIKGKGKTPIGWNDILKDSENLPRETTIMSWLGSKAVKEAASKGFYTVATPTSYLYLDITQDSRNDGTMSDLAYSNVNSLERIYGYDPTTGLEDKEIPYVLGVQANQWTAIPQEIKDVNVQNFPRLLALSEIAWSTPETKDYGNFLEKLETHYRRLDFFGMDYFTEGGYIVAKWSPDDISEDYTFLDFDITDEVYASGRAMAGMFYVEGASYLDIKGAQILEDKQVVSEDLHQGLADTFRGTSKKKSFLYNLEVENYNPKAKYTLRIEVKGTDGINSFGNVTFNLSPYEPFDKYTIKEKGRKSK